MGLFIITVNLESLEGFYCESHFLTPRITQELESNSDDLFNITQVLVVTFPSLSLDLLSNGSRRLCHRAAWRADLISGLMGGLLSWPFTQWRRRMAFSEGLCVCVGGWDFCHKLAEQKSFRGRKQPPTKFLTKFVKLTDERFSQRE